MIINLPDLIYREVIDQNDANPHEWKQHWYPSGIGADTDSNHVGKCRRALFFDLTNADKTDPMDAPAIFKCNVGDLIHDYLNRLLTNQLLKLGWELQNINGDEIPVVWKPDGVDFEFSGRLDYLFKKPDGKYVAVEWKSTYGRGFDMIKKTGAKVENLLQCCCYLNQDIYPLDEVLLMYAGRDNGYLLGYVVSKDPDQGLKIEQMGTELVSFSPIYFEDILKSCKVVEKCVAEGILPKKDFGDKDWQCKYCSYATLCSEKEKECSTITI